MLNPDLELSQCMSGGIFAVYASLLEPKTRPPGLQKYIHHVWCGSGQTSKEACSEIRNATAFSWLGDAAEGPVSLTSW